MIPVELDEVRKQLDNYLSKGCIRPSTSFYGAPILFARENGSTLRMCIHYMALNQKKRPENYPLPRIDDLLERFANAHYLSSINLHTG